MPGYTTPDAIKYPVGTDSVAPLSTVLTDLATTTQTAITDVRNDIAASIAAQLVPVGTVLATARSTAPSGWVLCQGQSLPRVGTYAALFDAIGTNYGSVDGASFNVPNLKGKVPVGIDPADSDFNAPNKTGGAKNTTLQAVNLPPHKHLFGADDMIESQGGYTRQSSFAYDAISTNFGGGGNMYTRGLYDNSNNSVSGSTPFSNMQPYNTVHYMIKY